jgi:hypothetical protein
MPKFSARLRLRNWKLWWARRTFQLRGLLRILAREIWIGTLIALSFLELTDTWPLANKVAGLFVMTLVVVVFSLKGLPTDTKLVLVKELGTDDRKRALLFVMYHYARYIEQEHTDLRRVESSNKPSRVEWLKTRRVGQQGADYLRRLVEMTFKDFGVDSPEEIYQLLGGTPETLRRAVDAFIECHHDKILERDDASRVQYEVEEDAIATRLLEEFRMREDALRNPELVWRAFQVSITHGTHNGILSLARHYLEVSEEQGRATLLKLVKGSRRGLLVKYLADGDDSLSNLHPEKVRAMITRFRSDTQTLATNFANVLKIYPAKGVTVFVLGYSHAVIQCLRKAQENIRVVYVVSASETGSRAAEQMAVELSGLKTPHRLVKPADIRRLLTRDAIAIIGFEGITPDLKVVYPHDALGTSLAAFKATPVRVPVYLVGEAWKVVKLDEVDELQYQRSLYPLLGKPILITSSGRELSGDDLRAALEALVKRKAAQPDSEPDPSSDELGAIVLRVDGAQEEPSSRRYVN